jgi:hypothetical protein
MEGNLVVDEDLKQSIVNWGRRKSWMRNRKWRSKFICDICVDLNDEAKTSWKMRRQLNSHQEQNRLGIGKRRETEQTTNKLFECLLQDCLSWQM